MLIPRHERVGHRRLATAAGVPRDAVRKAFRQALATGRQLAVRGFVGVQADADLLHVVAALDAGRGAADLLHGGQQQADKNRDDGDDHQQLDQREARTKRAFHGRGLRTRKIRKIKWMNIAYRGRRTGRERAHAAEDEKAGVSGDTRFEGCQCDQGTDGVAANSRCRHADRGTRCRSAAQVQWRLRRTGISGEGGKWCRDAPGTRKHDRHRDGCRPERLQLRSTHSGSHPSSGRASPSWEPASARGVRETSDKSCRGKACGERSVFRSWALRCWGESGRSPHSSRWLFGS